MAIYPNGTGGGGGGAGSPDTGAQIVSKLEALTGNDRLAASAIKGLSLPEAGNVLVKMADIATTNSIHNGAQFTFNQGDDFLIGTGIPMIFNQSHGRVPPTYHNVGGYIGFQGGDGDDPTSNTEQLLEIVIPYEYLNGTSGVYITSSQSEVSGTRRIWAFDGSPVSGSNNEVDILRSNPVNETGTRTTKLIPIPDTPTGADLHILISRQIVWEIGIYNKAFYDDAEMASARLPEAAKYVREIGGYSHGDVLNFSEADMLLNGMGVGAYFRQDEGRVAPFLGSNNALSGFYTPKLSTSPTASGGFVEIVIPSECINRGMAVVIQRAVDTLSPDTNCYIAAYQGDPTSSGTRLTPLYGTDVNDQVGKVETVAYPVADDNEERDQLIEDMHIVISGQWVVNIEVTNLDLTGGVTSEVIRDRLQALTGDNRLDQSAIKDLADARLPGKNILTLIDEIVDNADITYAHGDHFREEDANLFIRGTGYDMTWRNDFGRTMPRFWSFEGDRSFYCLENASDDPTVSAAYAEFIIPEHAIGKNKTLAINFEKLTSSGTHTVRVYNQRPEWSTTTGSEITPRQGKNDSGTGGPVTTFFDIPDAHQSIHVVMNGVVMWGVEILDRGVVDDIEFGNESIAVTSQYLRENHGYGTTERLSAVDANKMIRFLGFDAEFQTSADLPRIAHANGNGFTVPQGETSLIHISPLNITREMQISFVRAAAANGVAGQSIRVFEGLPSGAGVEITPIVGTQEEITGVTSRSRVVFPVCVDPTLDTMIGDDIYIQITGQQVFDIQVGHSVDELALGAKEIRDSLETLTGDDRLDSSAVKNLYPSEANVSAFTPVDGDWYTVATVTPDQPNEVDTWVNEFVVEAVSGTEACGVRFVAGAARKGSNRSADITVTNFVHTSAAGSEIISGIRVIRPDSTVTSNHIIQVQLSTSAQITGTVKCERFIDGHTISETPMTHYTGTGEIVEFVTSLPPAAGSGGYSTAEEVRNALETLSDDNRLSASAIKGFIEPIEQPVPSFTPPDTTSWYTIATIAPKSGVTESTFLYDLGMELKTTTDSGFVRAKISGSHGGSSRGNALIEVEGYAESDSLFSAIRVIRPNAVLNSSHFVQVRIESTNSVSGRILQYSDSDGFTLAMSAALAKFSPIGSEVIESTTDLPPTIVSPDTAEDIRNKLETLTGNDRLDATAIKGIDAYERFNAKVKQVADDLSIGHAQDIQFENANRIMSTTGVPIVFKETNGRAKPKLYYQNNGYAIYGGDGDDPTADQALIEFIVPRDFLITSYEIMISVVSSSSSGTRRIWAYDGDPNSGGTEIGLTRGTVGNLSTTEIHTKIIPVPDSTNDLHIVVSRQAIWDFAIFNKANRWDAVYTSMDVSTAARWTIFAKSYEHDSQLELADANQTLLRLGNQAGFRTTNGRVLPNTYSTASVSGLACPQVTGFNAFTDQGVTEIVIDKRSLNRDMEIAITRQPLSGGSNDERIEVYEGNPTSGGTKISPNDGNEIHSTAGQSMTTVWSVASDLSVNTPVDNDLHIVISGQIVTNIEIKVGHDEQASVVRDKLQSLTGDERLDGSAIKGFIEPLTKTVVPFTPASDEWYDVLTVSKGVGATNDGFAIKMGIDIHTASESATLRFVAAGSSTGNTASFHPISQIDSSGLISGIRILRPAAGANVNHIVQVRLSTSASISGFVYQYNDEEGFTSVSSTLSRWTDDSSQIIENSVDLPFNYDEETPTQIRDKLQTLTGTNRLDGLAIDGMLDKGDSFLQRIDEARTRGSYAHNAVMDQANSDFVAGCLGANATFNGGTGRTLPAYYQGSRGRGIMWGAVTGTPTASTSDFAELVIPNEYLSPGMQLAVTHASVSSTDPRKMWVYEDTIADANEVTPVFGDGENLGGDPDTTVWEVADATKDLRLVGSRQVVLNMVLNDGNFVSTSGGGDTAVEIRDKLQGLTGDNRLDASAIKNVQETETVTATIDTTGGTWIDVIVWDALAVGATDAVAANFVFYGTDTSGRFLFESTVRAFGSRTSAQGTLTVMNRTSDYPNPDTQAIYRIVRDSAAANDVLRLQIFSDYAGDFRLTVINQFPLPYGATVTFGAFTAYTPTGTEVELDRLDATRWNELDIAQGMTGGLHVNAVGLVDRQGSYLNFTDQGIEHRVGDSLTLESLAEGTVISGSAAGTFVTPTDVMTGGVSAIVSPRYISGSEFGAIETRVSNNGMTYVSQFVNHAGDGPTMSAMRSDDQTQLIDFQIPEWLAHDNERIVLTLVVQAKGISNALDGRICMYDQAGMETQRETLPASNDNDLTTTVRLLVPIGSSRFSIGNYESAAVAIGIRSYHLELSLPEASLDDHLVAKFHSHTRAVSLPAIIDNGTRPFETGDLRKEPISGLVQEYVNDGWNYIAHGRFGLHTSPHFASYAADDLDGDYLAQGWETEGGASRITVVNDQYGYPSLLHFVDNDTSTLTGIAHGLNAAAAQSMQNNGFRWDFTARVDDGDMINYIEMTDDYIGTSGRWIFGINGTGSTIVVSDIGGSGNSKDLGVTDQMVRISLQVEANTTSGTPPADSTGKLYINGEFAFDVPYQTRSIANNAIRHTSGSSVSVDENFWLLDSVFFSLSGTVRGLTRDEIASSIRYNIPNVENDITITVAKGTYSIGSTFTIVNGSSKVATVIGVDNDPQLFEGNLEYKVDPYTEVTFTQTSYLRGNNWAADVKNRDSVVEIIDEVRPYYGNTIHLNVLADTTQYDAGGSYVGTISVTRPATDPVGVYRIVPDNALGHVFGISNTRAVATALRDTSNYNANVRFGTGYLEVRTYDESNNLADSDFSIFMEW